MSVYLDYNATCPIDPRVVEAMAPWFSRRYGNPSSRDHVFGWDAAEAVETARASVADWLRMCRDEIVFVSSATEALNTAIRSYVGFTNCSSRKILTCATEHDAVLATVRYLSCHTGVGVEILEVDSGGNLDLGRLSCSLENSPGSLVAVMAANNEIGTVHSVRDIADITHAAGSLFLCDTTQAFGRMPLVLRSDGIDYASVSAHKIGGPPGVGALLIRRGLGAQFHPLIAGGGQEASRRGGTQNVAGVVGFAHAASLLSDEGSGTIQKLRSLRDRLEEALLSEIERAWVNGASSNRLCNTANIGFAGIDARILIRDMHDIACSTRAACSSGDSGPSHVLKAIGLSDEDAYSCIRFSLGRFTTEEEIDYTIDKVVKSVHKLRRNKSIRM